MARMHKVPRARSRAPLSLTQLVCAVVVLLALLWSAVEIVRFDRNPYWPFLLPCAVSLLLVYRYRWVTALYVALWAFVAWCLLLLVPDYFLGRAWVAGERVALWQLYVFVGITIYILGRGMSW